VALVADRGAIRRLPGLAHERAFADLLRAVGKAGNLSNEAHLAALAIEHGATLVSFDRDFDRFDGWTSNGCARDSLFRATLRAGAARIESSLRCDRP
jgi:hypothetical protein